MAYNILLVDDSVTVRAVMAKTLRLAHVPVNEIYEAADGRAALDILRDNWIDLVLSDINMPGMNGIEMIEAMARDGLLESIPVIVVSTEGSEQRIARLREQGVAAYIRKPFTPEQLHQVISETMGAHQ